MSAGNPDQKVYVYAVFFFLDPRGSPLWGASLKIEKALSLALQKGLGEPQK